MTARDKHSPPLRIRCKGAKSGSNYSVVELLHDNIVLRGECWLSVLSGCVEVLGATLTPDHDVVHIKSTPASTKSFVLRKTARWFSGCAFPEPTTEECSIVDKHVHNKIRTQQRKHPWSAEASIVLVTTARKTETGALNGEQEGLNDNESETVLLQIRGEAVFFAREASSSYNCEDQSCRSASHAPFFDTTSRSGAGSVLVCGQANTSQTFDRVINRLLSKGRQVIALDAELSQSDFHPAGVLSVCLCRSYKLSDSPSDIKQLGARFLGHTTANRNPALFFHQLLSLITLARESSWALDIPMVLRITLNKAMRGYLQDVFRALNVSCVVQVGDEDWYSSEAAPDVCCFLDFDPELTTNSRNTRTDESRSSLSKYFLRPRQSASEMHQMPLHRAPIWNSQAEILHPLEIGAFLVFCEASRSDMETRPLEQNWLGFGLVCGIDMANHVAEVLSPLPRDLIMSSECFLVNGDFLQEDGAFMFPNQVMENMFFSPGAISGARAMRSRRNLLRFPVS